MSSEGRGRYSGHLSALHNLYPDTCIPPHAISQFRGRAFGGVLFLLSAVGLGTCFLLSGLSAGACFLVVSGLFVLSHVDWLLFRLVAAGQLLTALKKVSDRRISRSRSGRGGGMDRHTEEHIQKAIQRLQQVRVNQSQHAMLRAAPIRALLFSHLPASCRLRTY